MPGRLGVEQHRCDIMVEGQKTMSMNIKNKKAYRLTKQLAGGALDHCYYGSRSRTS